MGYIMEKEHPQEAQLFDVPRFNMQPSPFFNPDFFQNQQMAFQEQGGMAFPPQHHPQAHPVPPQLPQIKNIFG